MSADTFIDATMYREHCMTARLVTARKSHHCDYSRDVSWFRACRGYVRPGEQYVRVTVFPGHDFLSSVKRPESGACCIPCAEGYDGLAELAQAVQP